MARIFSQRQPTTNAAPTPPSAAPPPSFAPPAAVRAPAPTPVTQPQVATQAVAPPAPSQAAAVPQGAASFQVPQAINFNPQARFPNAAAAGVGPALQTAFQTLAPVVTPAVQAGLSALAPFLPGLRQAYQGAGRAAFQGAIGSNPLAGLSQPVAPMGTGANAALLGSGDLRGALTAAGRGALEGAAPIIRGAGHDVGQPATQAVLAALAPFIPSITGALRGLTGTPGSVQETLNPFIQNMISGINQGALNVGGSGPEMLAKIARLLPYLSGQLGSVAEHWFLNNPGTPYNPVANPGYSYYPFDPGQGTYMNPDVTYNQF